MGASAVGDDHNIHRYEGLRLAVFERGQRGNDDYEMWIDLQERGEGVARIPHLLGAELSKSLVANGLITQGITSDFRLELTLGIVFFNKAAKSSKLQQHTFEQPNLEQQSRKKQFAGLNDVAHYFLPSCQEYSGEGTTTEQGPKDASTLLMNTLKDLRFVAAEMIQFASKSNDAMSVINDATTAVYFFGECLKLAGADPQFYIDKTFGNSQLQFYGDDV